MPVDPWEPTLAARFLILLLKEVDKPYVLGSEGPVTEPLATYDCSELVQNGLGRTGLTEVSDGQGRVRSLVTMTTFCPVRSVCR